GFVILAALDDADIGIPLPCLDLEQCRGLDLHGVEDFPSAAGEAETVDRQRHVEACRVVRRVESVAARVKAFGAAEEDAELLSRLRERRCGDENEQQENCGLFHGGHYTHGVVLFQFFTHHD